jgi:hypothetical protein
MARGTGTLVEKVVAEVVEVAEVDVVDGVVIHVMREVVVFEDKIMMKMAEQSRVVSCSCFFVILCGPV